MSKGVWLRFDQPLVRGPSDRAGRWTIDPRTFKAWISLDYGGGEIPLKNGRLTREALLANSVLGANCYVAVHQGSMQRTLDKALKSIRGQISEGSDLHIEWDRHRDAAAPRVVPISDALGGADFPSTRIWKLPHDLVVQALTQNVGGNVKESSKSAIYAAITTEFAAKVLNQYFEDTTTGAQRAVKILTILKTAGQIAEFFLVVRALVGGLVRLMAAEAAETGGGAAARTVVKDRSPGAHYPTNHQIPPNAKFRPEFENTWNNVSRTPVTGQGGSAINRVDLATQQKFNGWHEDFARGVKDLMAKKGDKLRGWVVSSDELVTLDRIIIAKWGDIWLLYP